MKTSDFDYHLPEELIAQTPLENRLKSRLLLLDKENGQIEHKSFEDLTSYLRAGDCLVLNDSRVLPARLFASRPGKEEKIEILLLTRKEEDTWECLVRPGKKARKGARLEFGQGLIKAEVVDIGPDGNRFIKMEYDGIFEEILDELGEMPLPPYIKEKLEDRERYQTVYSRENGSAAAPTAGLHFNQDFLEELKNRGVKLAFLTLHVGLGTFRPVKADNIEDHHMHAEYYSLSEDTASLINETRHEGGRIIAVGTTSARTLESLVNKNGIIEAGSGWTDIFIYPGYQYKIVDGLLTNFHLPESSLLMLVSALAGKDLIMDTYKIAVEERYRFFSFGDAMFIY